jgi:predicted negative regulator of RcsB-dependent stress response
VLADPPTKYAVTNMGERTVTIKLNSIPATQYVLTANVEGNVTQLSGALMPQFSEDYHDILVNMVMADELEKAEKYDKAAAKLKQALARMGDMRLFIAKSAYKETVQGSRSR